MEGVRKNQYGLYIDVKAVKDIPFCSLEVIKLYLLILFHSLRNKTRMTKAESQLLKTDDLI